MVVTAGQVIAICREILL